ncbi:hypothetical protein [Flavitalea sp.]|nr:hypothetical protein [Flavitalea sp.]
MIRVFALSALIITSCGESSIILTEDEKKIITRDVKQTLQNYSDDIRKTGLKAEFKYLDSSSDFFWVPPGYNSAISYDSVAFILKQNAPLLTSINNVYEILKIVPIGKYQACYTARVISNVTDTKGNSSTTSLIETGVLIKRPTGWKLLSGQTSMINSTQN